jgi:hypothetical protein
MAGQLTFGQRIGIGLDVGRFHRYEVIASRHRRWGHDVLCPCGWESWRACEDRADEAGRAHVHWQVRLATMRWRRERGRG